MFQHRQVSLAEGPVVSSAQQAYIIALLHRHLMDVSDPEAEIDSEGSRNSNDVHNELISRQ